MLGRVSLSNAPVFSPVKLVAILTGFFYIYLFFLLFVILYLGERVSLADL